MSDAKWCDVGKHAYPANQMNAQQLTVTRQVRNQWNGVQPSAVTQDICAECAAGMGLLTVDEELETVRESNDTRRAIKEGARHAK